jgi:hypothetical protein
VVDIEFNFYGAENIQRSIHQLFITPLTRQQAKAQILGRTLSQTTETGSFCMTIDGLMVRYDERNSLFLVVEIFGQDAPRSLYVRRSYHRAQNEDMRYPGTLLNTLIDELDTTKKAVFL